MAPRPIVVITGPTASGKTGLAIQIARDYDGEVISADSRAVYRHLNIGTAKPTLEDQQGIPHWGIDIVDPGQRFTAADFKEYADERISDIRTRGKLPILVGGTGLYIDSVVYDYQFPAGGNDVVRRHRYEAMTLDELYEYCKENNVVLPENYKNKRYVVNSILRKGYALERRSVPIEDCIVVGISTKNEILRDRIHDRAVQMFEDDIIEEACRTAQKYGWENEAMTGNVYPLIRQLQEGKLSGEEAIRKFEVLDWRLAKRQMAWLRRSPDIYWLELQDAYTYLAQRLADVDNL